ncbi:hypothetical protein [Thermoflavimicrobium daqui]|uniref:Uncharacterized protein n=1 Tax=Thermoflavimicrobium daqui TaxID=2137476 RepID=A0A364K4T5_9BACL|nr:hypothetical protein [Thermoflavimicrobium daqui]RAL24347.1 hypothetical protein DL897_08450 [Thermoflavimicrobium daqui]
MNTARYLLFIEYQVKDSKWNDFLAARPNLKENVKQIGPILSHSFLESKEQAGLIVEIIEAKEPHLIEQVKQLRTATIGGVLDEFDSLIKGGREKVRAWTFGHLD